LKKPNGLVGTPDGKTLYVADIEANKTYKYQIAPDGRLTNRQLFVGQGSDGMTIDNQGNIYLTGKGVTVYNAAGQQIEHIDVPEEWTANLCFGGKDRKTLFITASEAVYVLPMRVKGV
jgi:gluconolactonase